MAQKKCTHCGFPAMRDDEFCWRHTEDTTKHEAVERRRRDAISRAGDLRKEARRKALEASIMKKEIMLQRKTSRANEAKVIIEIRIKTT